MEAKEIKLASKENRENLNNGEKEWTKIYRERWQLQKNKSTTL